MVVRSIWAAASLSTTVQVSERTLRMSRRRSWRAVWTTGFSEEERATLTSCPLLRMNWAQSKEGAAKKRPARKRCLKDGIINIG